MAENSLLSLIMIVRDNSRDLNRCLDSVKGLVDEIIIVDTGSIDNTKEIAEKYTYKIYDYKWDGNFSSAKNYALKWAKGSWVINLDADESLSPKDHSTIKEMILTAPIDVGGFSLIQRNYANEIGKFGWVSSKDDSYDESKVANGFVPRRIVRIFRRDPKIFFEGAVHDSVEKSILRSSRVLESSIPIHHYGMIGRPNSRTEMYVSMEKENLRPRDFFQRYQIATQLHSLGRLDESLVWLDESMLINRNFLLSWLEKGTIYLEKGDLDEAIKCLEEARELGEHEMVFAHLGIAHAKKGDFSSAIDNFRKALKINPKNADFYYNIGLALHSQGRMTEAGLAFRRAIELNPEYAKMVKVD
jgi:glycosyltransferase involved in cell wall biosynthesis